MINTQVLKGNLIRQDYTTAFVLNQGDKGVPFKVELLENGNPYTLQSTDIVTIEWLKPNGNPFLQEGNIKYGTNYIEFTTPESLAQYSGSGTFNIIISNNNVRKGTIRREYKVIPTSLKPGSVSEDVITDAITELRELNSEIAETLKGGSLSDYAKKVDVETEINTINASLEEKANQIDMNKVSMTLDNKMEKGESITVQQIDKNKGKIDETYLSDTLLEQIAGTTPISSTIADLSITTDKLANLSVDENKIKENSINVNHLNKSLLQNNKFKLMNVHAVSGEPFFAIAQIDLQKIGIESNKEFNIKIEYSAITDNSNVESVSNNIFINNSDVVTDFSGGDILGNLKNIKFKSGIINYSLCTKNITTSNRYLKVYLRVNLISYPIDFNVTFDNIRIYINNQRVYTNRYGVYTQDSNATWDVLANLSDNSVVTETYTEGFKDYILRCLEKNYIEKSNKYDELDNINVSYQFNDLDSVEKHLVIMFDIKDLLDTLTGEEKFSYSFKINQDATSKIQMNLFNNDNSEFNDYASGDIIPGKQIQITKNLIEEVNGENFGNINNKYRYIRFSVSYTLTSESKHLSAVIENLNIKLGEYNLTPYLLKCDVLNDLGEYCEYCKTSSNFVLRKKDLDIFVDFEKSTKINLNNYRTLRYSEINENYGFIGRWFEKEIDGIKHMVTINQGSELYFKVKNTNTVSLIFKEITSKATPYFAYSIDGSNMTRQKITEPLITLSDTGEHIIRIIIDGLTETEDKWYGEIGVAFEKATVDSSGTIKGILPKNRKIMFFGDSITEGIRVLGMGADSNINSASGAFPYIACENLNSVSIRVGFGATGILREGSGGVPKCLTVIDSMTNSRETPYEEPDIIVLNHGTNDGDRTSEEFIEGYNEVLNRLSIKYSGVPIFAVIPFGQSHAQDIKTCVSTRPYVYLIETEDWGVTYTDGTHPDVNGSKIAGRKLAEEIIKVLGKNYFI